MARQRKVAREPRGLCNGRGAKTVRVCLCGFLAALAAIMTPAGHGRADPAARPAEVDPRALDALARTSAYLRHLHAFVVHAETMHDEIVQDDFKLQRTTDVRLAVRGRDRMRVETVGDQGERLLVYDGNALHIHLGKERYYASMPAAATLRETLEAALERHGIELPLLDLVYLATGGDLSAQVRAAGHVGVSKVGGVACEHLAFRGTKVDWQLWVAAGREPVPHKLVVTTKDSPTRQQYSALLQWEVSPELDDRKFSFSPPLGASPIALGPLPAEAAAESTPGEAALESGPASTTMHGHSNDANPSERHWRGGWFTLLLAALPFVHVPVLAQQARASSRDLTLVSIHAAEARVDKIHYDTSANDAWGHPASAGVRPLRTPPAPGAIVSAPPPHCQIVVASALTYHRCGGIYYQPAYYGSAVHYVVVNAP